MPESNSEKQQPEAAATDKSPKVVTLSTPLGIGTLIHPDGKFPPITERGTELTQDEANEAEKVAARMRFKFYVRGEDKRKKEVTK